MKKWNLRSIVKHKSASLERDKNDIIVERHIITDDNDALRRIAPQWEAVYVDSLMKHTQWMNAKDPCPTELQDVLKWKGDICEYSPLNYLRGLQDIFDV